MTVENPDLSRQFTVAIDAPRGIAEVSGSNLSPETSKAVLSLVRDTGRSKWFWIALLTGPPITALAARAPEIICAARGLEGCA